MAEGTHIGAAHPVTMGGQMSETMEKKAENDAVSFIRSIADTRGRNADWGEAAVRESESITSTEALENSVVDMICPSFDSLLVRLHGREVKTAEGMVTLDTRDALVVEKKTGWRYKLLSIIAEPNIAYILMVLGFYGLLFELSNPGSILPGVVGGICLILAFFALQVLPLNWAGLFLILFAVILFIAEVKVTSYGLLTVGGVISFLVGSLMLFQDAEGDLAVSLKTILPVTIATVLFFVFVVYKAIRAQGLKPTTGAEGMVGLDGVVRSPLQPAGQVMVHGELWEAECSAEVRVGDKIKVTGVRGLTLLVEKLNQEDGT
jgi:membrane-bound serine protease (ClpP class)